jgi:hypothetical protein
MEFFILTSLRVPISNYHNKTQTKQLPFKIWHDKKTQILIQIKTKVYVCLSNRTNFVEKQSYEIQHILYHLIRVSKYTESTYFETKSLKNGKGSKLNRTEGTILKQTHEESIHN